MDGSRKWTSQLFLNPLVPVWGTWEWPSRPLSANNSEASTPVPRLGCACQAPTGQVQDCHRLAVLPWAPHPPAPESGDSGWYVHKPQAHLCCHLPRGSREAGAGLCSWALSPRENSWGFRGEVCPPLFCYLSQCLYQLSSGLGARFVSGKVRVLNLYFIFTSATAICPIMDSPLTTLRGG